MATHSSSSASPYWNAKMECASHEELERVQLHKLQVLVRHAYDRSPFYRRHFDKAEFHPGQLKSLDDVGRIPFLTKDDLLDEQAAKPIFGELYTCNAQLRGVRYAQTSGTSGKTPFRVADTIADMSLGADTWALGLYGFGIRQTDTVYLAFGYGPFIGFWGVHAAVEKIGCVTVPGGAQSTEGRLKQIIDLGATVVVATPTYAIRLAEAAREMGLDLANSPVRILAMAGEPGGNIPATKRLIESSWGAKAGDFAGMTETSGPGLMMFECSHQPGGMHIIDDWFLEEVLDPATGEAVGYGNSGELVSTGFIRGALPGIRYRSGDLVIRVEGSSCTCGRTYDIFMGGIIGRVDDMKVIRGTNVYPGAVEGILREFSEITEFQIVIERVDNRDEITTKIELTKAAGQADSATLCRRLQKELAEGHEGLRFNVEVAEPHSLPRFELKSRRVVDKRPTWSPP